MNVTESAMRLVREQWDNAPKAEVIDLTAERPRLLRERRDRERDGWLRTWTRPMPSDGPEAA